MTAKIKREETYDWPLWFSKNLSQAEQKKLKKIIPILGRAQTYLWRALNIYDDFLDGEGKRRDLPQANIYLRRYLGIHYGLNLSSDYYKLFNKIMDDLDNANKEEVLTPKLIIKNSLIALPLKLPPEKKLNSLSRKSLALALGPLALLFTLGYKKSNKKIIATLNFFKYGLAAKQLSDDSHDWFEDLENGFITRANRPILSAAKKRNLKINLKQATNAYLLYASEASPLIIQDIEILCRKARREMSKISFPNKGANKSGIILRKLITPLEEACLKAKNFRALLVKNP